MEKENADIFMLYPVVPEGHRAGGFSFRSFREGERNERFSLLYSQQDCFTARYGAYSVSMNDYLRTALRAARAAARIHQRNVGGDLGIQTKSTETDLVTRVDKESEAKIREILLGEYPDHIVLGEEEGQPKESASHRWIVDPLDGTLNYAHGFPFYCVSIALEIKGELRRRCRPRLL